MTYLLNQTLWTDHYRVAEALTAAHWRRNPLRLTFCLGWQNAYPRPVQERLRAANAEFEQRVATSTHRWPRVLARWRSKGARL